MININFRSVICDGRSVLFCHKLNHLARKRVTHREILALFYTGKSVSKFDLNVRVMTQDKIILLLRSQVPTAILNESFLTNKLVRNVFMMVNIRLVVTHLAFTVLPLTRFSINYVELLT